ncbi:hypothetical protein NA57DRAFT_77726 [Rhizodiscina lignyota]|uniref:Cohesin loading factor n=1 Tax=Rhizodiscina lignyota TaxID=1504668 RepID=A0A9P4IB50_9PEZI|nr:hypothetical protein NA57DRAFT_77726 [Rhizodiscina lignyota]
MDWQMFNPYGSHPNGAYASSGQPNRPINYPPPYLPHAQQQPHSIPPPPPPQAAHQYNAASMVIIPQRPPDYLSQFQDLSDYREHMQQQPRQPKQPRPQPRAHQHDQMLSTPTSRKPEVIPQLPPQPPKPASPPVDLQQLLLSLADEYISTARGMGPMVALMKQDTRLQEYYKLIAMGMRCMDAVLRKYRLEPRAEASLRLRYATLLFEETNNNLDAEEVLNKGNRLLDLKYSMQHLQARVLFRTKPKAALKSLDKLIPDVETFQHTAWTYALRFLRVTLSSQMESHQESLVALQHLRSISATAESFGDVEIFITSAAFEAMIHLKSGGPESIEQAQRAIASARSYQLQLPSTELSQVWAILDIVDLACSLKHSQNPEQANMKMNAMQHLMDEANPKLAWNSDGSFTVCLNHIVDPNLIGNTGDILNFESKGQVSLSFHWLPQRDLYMLGYYLSGITAIQSKSITDDKANNYLLEGLRMAKELLKSPSTDHSTVTTASQRYEWHAMSSWFMRLQLALIACQRADWTSARSHLDRLETEVKDPAFKLTDDISRWLRYVEATISQAIGDTTTAVEIFLSPIFALPTNKNRMNDAQTDLCILAALNTLLVIRSPMHNRHTLFPDLLARLEPFCIQHANKSIHSAFYLMRAISPRTDESTILKMKQHLQLALKDAKAINNSQLLYISLNFMTAFFFKDLAGDQAEKSARTGLHLAKRGKSQLWTCAANGMLADTLARCGKGEEAARVRSEAEKGVGSLPSPLRDLCTNGVN